MTEKIRMAVTKMGAPDHIHAHRYKEGEVYEVGTQRMPEWLAKAFLATGSAVPDGKAAKGHAPSQPPEGGAQAGGAVRVTMGKVQVGKEK